MKKITYGLLIGLMVTTGQTIASNDFGNEFHINGTVQATDLLIDIYPNPTSKYLNVKQLQFDGSISQLEVFDLSGHTVYYVNEKFTQLSIYVGTWKKGVYVVFFRQGDKEITHKIVVQ
ncbi:MAG: T9SS type A sorting domain-containing protein [Reichenbachiella sp.]|uniref:T9SS type A sorting domain-containing protein n=1 Tax=Reichenbachiella sp. TaxID=2184521 RepID=UPI0032667906